MRLSSIDNVITKVIVNNRTDALKTEINLFFTVTIDKSCVCVRSRSLKNRINYKFMRLSAYWLQKLDNERARISAVIAKNIFNGVMD